MMIRSLLVLTFALTALEAQVKPGRVAAEEVGAFAGPDGGDTKGSEPGDDKKVPLDNNMPRRGALHCEFRADLRPAKLMPGQSGVVFVTMLLKERAVLPAPAPLKLTSPAAQGLLTFGSPIFHEAGLGTLAPGYRGRPVYDNYAIFEVPVTVQPGGELAIGTKLPVNLEFQYDLHDGETGNLLGQFVDRAGTNVEIGQALDPAVVGGYSSPVMASAVEAPAAGNRGRAQVEPEADSRPAAIGGTSLPVQVEPTPTVVPDAGPEAGNETPLFNGSAGEEELPTTLIAVGAGLLLLLVLLLARRRR